MLLPYYKQICVVYSEEYFKENKELKEDFKSVREGCFGNKIVEVEHEYLETGIPFSPMRKILGDTYDICVMNFSTGQMKDKLVAEYFEILAESCHVFVIVDFVDEENLDGNKDLQG